MQKEGDILEVLKINDSKLKLMLSASDMQAFGLTAETVDYNNASVRKSFFKILDSVKQSHGFDAEGDKLLIQYYPDKEGGCELFVTKLGLLPLAAERAISRSNRITLLQARRVMYRFSDFESLLLAVRLFADERSKESDVYTDDSGEYYLEIVERGSGRASTLTEHSRLIEFAKQVPQSSYPYIQEHCERLTDKDAIDKLLRLAY